MKIQNITPDVLSEIIGRGKKTYLVDTLPEDHFLKVRIPGSKNACVYQVNFLSQVKTITEDLDAEIVVYGSSHRSQDSRIAAEKLQRAGYRRIAILQGGIKGWRAAGQPLEGSVPDRVVDPLTRLSLETGIYTLDVQQSVVGWTGRNRNSSHVGTVRFGSGRIAVTEAGFTGSLTVDMASMENLNLAGDPLQAVLIDHLKSDDFFLVALFPKATFTISEARLRDEPYLTAANCDIVGELSLRDVTRNLSFPATLTTTPEVIYLEAHFDLDRTDWGIIYGSARFFEHLGMHQVFEAISISLRLVLICAQV
jgi:polyisoprenoid-binding protein YceI/rhodanese-related sulfurtransferase